MKLGVDRLCNVDNIPISFFNFRCVAQMDGSNAKAPCNDENSILNLIFFGCARKHGGDHIEDRLYDQVAAAHEEDVHVGDLDGQ